VGVVVPSEPRSHRKKVAGVGNETAVEAELEDDAG
jgi:hypothetical protein